MNLHRLAVFCAVVEASSLRGAARRLVLSESGVSMRLRALEGELGHRLLTRRDGRLQPTEAGAVVYAYAARTVSGADDLRRALAELAAGTRGELVVGASTSTGGLFVTEALGGFVRAHPDVAITVVVDRSEAVRALVQQGRCDLGYALSSGALPGLVQEPLHQGELLLAVAAHHPLAGGTPVALDTLRAQRFVTGLPNTAHRAMVDALLAANGLAGYTPAMQLADADTVRRATLDGVGVGLVMRHSVADDLAAGRLHEVRWPHGPLTVQYDLLYRAGHQFSPLLQRAVDCLRAARGPR